MLTSIGCTQTTPELTVWIRAGGAAVKTEITSFVQKVFQALPPSVTSRVLICTNENDTILNELDAIPCKSIWVVNKQS